MANPLLQTLHAAVSGHASLVIDAALPGCASLATELAAVLVEGAVTIAGATLTAPDGDGNFSVTGTSALFGTDARVEAAFFVSLDPDAVQVLLRALDPVPTWALPARFQVPVLGAAAFANATLAFASSGIAASTSTYAGDRAIAGEALVAGLNVHATLALDDAAWSVARVIVPALAQLDVSGAISPSADGPLLRLSHRLEGATFAATDTLALTLDSLGIECRLADGIEIPRLTFQGRAGGGKLPLELAVSTALGLSDALVLGSFGEGQAATLGDIGGLLGLDAGLLGSMLPQDDAESVFGALALRDLRLALALGPLRVTAFDCTVTAQRPWTVLSDRIWTGAGTRFGIEPILQFHVDDPFGPRPLQYRIAIGGRFSIGTTAFALQATFPDATIHAAMMDGEVLDVGALFDDCLPGAPKPDLSLTGLTLDADLAAHRADLSIAAAGTLSFDFGIATLSVLPQNFAATYDQGAVTAWGFGGAIVFAGLAFDITGNWRKDSGWALRAQRLNGDDLNVGSLFDQVLTEFESLAGAALPADIPDPFSGCAVTALAFDYSEADKRISILADVTNVLDLGALSVDEFAISLIFADKKPTTGHALARLSIAGFDIILRSAKDAGGWSFSGSTPPGEAVDLSALLESLAAVAGLSFPLPSEHLQVTDLVVAFNDGAERYFGFSCTVRTTSADTATDWGRMSGVAKKRGDGTWDHLVVLAIEHGFSFPLSDLPVAGPYLGDLSVDSLSCTIASDAFTSGDVAARNALLPDTALHAAEAPIAKGAHFGALGHFGRGAPVPLVLPLGGGPPQGDNSPTLAFVASAPASGPGPGGQTVWLDVNKSFRAVTFERIGLRYADGRVALLFDMTLTFGSVGIALMALGVSSPLTRFAPLPTIDGLGLDYASGPIAIGGGFLNVGGGFYEGFATVKTQAVSLAARGMYGSVDDHTSMFIYGLLDKPPVGGPPIFYIDGLAVGFGIDTRLNIPPIDRLATFSLLQGVLRDTTVPGDADDPGAVLAHMTTDIVPAVGSNWMAVGVRFNSFRIVESFALLMLQLGSRVEIDLIGLSTASIPPMADTPIAAGELLLEASLDPATGNFAIDGKLSPNSFVLSHDCHLTGGFAYRSWLSGDHAGDFVLTLGGYHPQFPRDQFRHYPAVERLGYVWHLSDNLEVKGASYFALTPNCLMAGGSLSALWHSGDVKAWFDVDADFLMYWKPFHYMADVHCSIGVSVRLNLLFTSTTITLSVGADLHFEGPPFGGYAHVDLWCVSFTVPFGDSAPPPGPITWETFKQSFLQAAKPQPSRLAMHAVEAEPAAADADIVTILPTAGMLRDRTKDADYKTGEPRWIFHPETIMLRTNSTIPAKTARFDVDGATQPWTGVPLAVGPSAISADHFETTHLVTLSRNDQGPASPNVVASPIYGGVAGRLWSLQGSPGQQPEVSLGDKGLVTGAICGIQIVRTMREPDHSCAIASASRVVVPGARTFAWPQPDRLPSIAADREEITRPKPGDPGDHTPDAMTFTPPGGTMVRNTDFVLAGVLDVKAVAARAGAIDAMRRAGMAVDATVALDLFGSTTELNDWPVVAPLGAQ